MHLIFIGYPYYARIQDTSCLILCRDELDQISASKHSRDTWAEWLNRYQMIRKYNSPTSLLYFICLLWVFVHFSLLSTRMLKLWGQKFFCHLQQYLAYNRCSLCICWIKKLIYSDQDLCALSVYRFIYLNLVILNYSFFCLPLPCYLNLYVGISGFCVSISSFSISSLLVLHSK